MRLIHCSFCFIGWVCLLGWIPQLRAQGTLDESVALRATNPAVQQLFEQLKATQGLRLAYSESYLNLAQRVRLPSVEPTIRELLDAIGQATNTTYELRNGQIIFRKRPTTYTISGYIRDAASGEDLIGASIWRHPSRTSDLNSGITLGTSSNAYGFYSLTLPATDTLRLRCSYVGHAPRTFTVALRQDTIINWSLSDETLAEVMVTSSTATPLEEPSVDLPIPPAELLKSPALLGEVDLLKSLQRLPGVQSGVDGGANLYVRGSGPDHNLLLLDGVPLYNASHLLGFFSVFNADAVNNFSFYKGDFPARYGGRLASVVDVQLKEGNRKKFQGTGAVGLLASRLTLEGPLGSSKTSFLLSSRYAHLGLYTWAASLANGYEGGTTYGFYNIAAKVNHTLSHRNQFYLSAYLGRDRYKDKFDPPDPPGLNEGSTFSYSSGLASGEDIQWGNLTTAFRWNHVYHRRLFSNLTLTYGRYRFGLNEKNERFTIQNGMISTSYSDKTRWSGIQDWAGRIDYDYRPSPYHHLRFGGGATYRTFRPGSVDLQYQFSDGPTADTAYAITSTAGMEADLFIEDELTLSSALSANVGVRYTGFRINQTTYSVAQPRLSLRYQPSSATVWSASYARTGQFMHLLANPSISLPVDLWLPPTERLLPEVAQQWAVSYRRKLGGTYEVQAEAYYRDLQNVVEFKEGLFDFYEEFSDWENRVASGQGRSYGVELLAQRTTGRITGWLGYTFSRSKRQFDEINNGRWFPFRYDRPHEIDFGGVFHWKEHIDVAWGWGFSSGLAITLPEVVYTERVPEYEPGLGYQDYQTDLHLVYGARNQHRTRPIHRLDVSISFHKPKRWGERTWEFGLYNLYSRRNPFFIGTTYRYENGDLAGYRFFQRSLFPIIPSVSYRFKF